MASLAFHQWFPAQLSEYLCGRAWLVWRFITGFQHSSDQWFPAQLSEHLTSIGATFVDSIHEPGSATMNGFNVISIGPCIWIPHSPGIFQDRPYQGFIAQTGKPCYCLPNWQSLTSVCSRRASRGYANQGTCRLGLIDVVSEC